MSIIASLGDLSPQARKGGLVVAGVVLILGLLALLPYLWLGSLREQREAEKAEYELVSTRFERLAGNQSVKLALSDHPERMFIPGATAGTTLAAFQTSVKALAVKSGLSVLRMQPLSTEEVDGLKPYYLSVDLTGSIENVQLFLADVESTLPIILVTGLDISPRSASTSTELSYPSEELAVTFKLKAYGLDKLK